MERIWIQKRDAHEAFAHPAQAILMGSGMCSPKSGCLSEMGDRGCFVAIQFCLRIRRPFVGPPWRSSLFLQPTDDRPRRLCVPHHPSDDGRPRDRRGRPRPAAGMAVERGGALLVALLWVKNGPRHRIDACQVPKIIFFGGG